VISSSLRAFKSKRRIKYTRQTKRWLLGLSFILLPIISIPINAKPYTQVYIEDSHAGSYYFFIERLNLTEEYQLILFDKHSDATEAFDSDSIRKNASEAKNDHSLDKLFQTWRNKGIIQCFNWIEPLMPKPFSKVVWVAGKQLSGKDLKLKKNEVDQQLNCHEVAFKRDCDNLANRFQVTDFITVQKTKDVDLPAVVSIDLDYFTGLDEAEQYQELEDVLNYTFNLPNLQAVSIAISYPYLQSPLEADRLLYISLQYLSRIKNIKLRYEPFIDNGPDLSELAKTFYKKKLPVPKYEINNASNTLKSLLLQIKFDINYNRELWQTLLKEWQNQLKIKPVIKLYKNGQIEPKERFNYFSIQDEVEIKLTGIESFSGGKVCWKVLYPKEKSINLTGKTYPFAANATKWIAFAEKKLAINNSELKNDDLINLFDSSTGFGTIRILAEVTDEDGRYQSEEICLCRYRDQSYLGKLSEIFNLPYILGSCLIREGNLIGPDAKYGADCSNFIIYGRRRLGYKIPYLNPHQLKQYLVEIDQVNRFEDEVAYGTKGKVCLDEVSIKEGLLLHFGEHIVAVYHDTEPKNILDYNDLVVHQLENFPEIIPLKNIKQTNKPFLVMKFK
jgi:hypothetical protein